MKRFVVVRQQDETDCGAACIATVARYYGKRVSLNRIRHYAGTDAMGTSGLGIVKGSEAIGFSCRGLIGSKKGVPDNVPLPWIAHIKKNGLEHYVVVYGKKRSGVVIADPDRGIVRMEEKSFLDLWSGVFFIMVPQERFERTKETKGVFERFLYLLRPHKRTLVECFLSGLILSVLGVLGAFYFRFLIDDVLYSSLVNTLWLCSVAYLVVILFQVILDFSRRQLMNYMSNKIDLALVCEYFKHILRLPMNFFTSRKTGEILSRIGDTATIRHMVSSTTLGVLIDSCMLVVGGAFMFLFGTKLLFVAMVPVVVSSILVWIFVGPFKKKLKEQAMAEADKQSALVESVNGIGTIKALSSEDSAFYRTESKITDCTRRSIKLGSMVNIQSALQTLVSRCGTLALYWVGSILILKGEMSLGQLISFVTLSGYFLEPLGRLLTLQESLQEAMISSVRLSEILDLAEEGDDMDESNSCSINQIKGNIKVKNLSFSYGSRGPALKNISLDIKAGQKVAFVGLSGSGKSTMTKLLMKFYAPEKGDIFVDGINLREIDTSSYRNCIGYVPQEILLFSGTIAENICWGSQGKSQFDMIKASKEARADEFIQRLEGRYNTVVGERGATLSGGERQRISLARVLLRKPDVLILDEATSSLDSISEKGIMDTINKAGRETTMIIVAHRLSTIKSCDKIFVFDKGSICECGNHETLLAKRGKYFEMWSAQNEEIDCVA